MTVLRPDECWALVRRAEVGRLAAVVDGRPVLFPVNFAIDHGTVVFRTAEGTKLAVAAAGGEVAFEVDGRDEAEGVAWSVVVAGHAQQISRADELVATTDLPVFPWNSAAKPYFVRVVPDAVTGRSFVVTDRSVWTSGLGGAGQATSE